MANGASSCQNFCQPLKAEPARDLVEIGRHRAQRLVEGEGHVPGLTGEDREDRGEFRAQGVAGEEAEEERHRERQKAQDRHRLEDVEHRDQHHFRAPALGRERGVREGEDERGREGREHAQHRPERVIGQFPIVQRHRRFAGRGQGRGNAVIAAGDGGQNRQNGRERDEVPIGSAGFRRPAETEAAIRGIGDFRLARDDTGANGRPKGRGKRQNTFAAAKAIANLSRPPRSVPELALISAYDGMTTVIAGS